MILTAYFDESGTHAGSPATIVSAVMATANQWARFQTEMDKIKHHYGFTVFHAKELKARSGEFSGRSYAKGLSLLRDMLPPSSRLMEAVTVTLPNDVYDEFYRGTDSPRRLRLDTKYGLCFRYALLNCTLEAVKRLRHHKKFNETRLNVVVESGHKNAGDVARIFDEMKKETAELGLALLDGITFMGKCDPIAIADYLAYGGLAMELAGRNKSPNDDPPPAGSKATGMSNIKFKPEHLSELKADLVQQIKSTGKAKFIGRSGASSGRPS